MWSMSLALIVLCFWFSGFEFLGLLSSDFRFAG